jgi:CheY-like chemotaxis protein
MQLTVVTISDPWRSQLAKTLIVNDDSAVQLTMLERTGHSLVAASDGRKGMAPFDAGDLDLLFPAISMPGIGWVRDHAAGTNAAETARRRPSAGRVAGNVASAP